MKADGYRIVARKDRLWTRQAVDYTEHFPRIAAAVAALPVDACVIDGEAVCFGEGRYDFHALRSRTGGRAACLIAFDLLMVDGVDLRGDPLKLRRERLQKMLCPAPPEGLLGGHR